MVGQKLLYCSSNLGQHLVVPHLHEVKDGLEGALVLGEVVFGFLLQLGHRLVVVLLQRLKVGDQAGDEIVTTCSNTKTKSFASLRALASLLLTD